MNRWRRRVPQPSTTAPAMLTLSFLLSLPGCYQTHERGAGPDFSSCGALGGVCEGSDLGCMRLGERFVYAGSADCIDREEGFACCVSLDGWTPSTVGQRCFEDAMCESGSCWSGEDVSVCLSDRECRAGGPSSCAADEHCWVPGDVAGFCLPRCDDGACPGLLVCDPSSGCVPP